MLRSKLLRNFISCNPRSNRFLYSLNQLHSSPIFASLVASNHHYSFRRSSSSFANDSKATAVATAPPTQPLTVVVETDNQIDSDSKQSSSSSSNNTFPFLSSLSSSSSSTSPRGFWKDPANQRRFLDWAATQLNLQQLDDWYNVSREDVVKLGGGSMLEKYNHSLIKALMTLYPEHEWLPWRFRVAPMGFWRNRNNHKLFFDWASRELQIAHLDDWYHISQEEFCTRLQGCIGNLLSAYYGGSLVKALMTIYPEHDWIPWRFPVVPHSFWKDPENHRRFFDWVARELRINSNNNNNADATTSPPLTTTTTTTATTATTAAATTTAADDDDNDGNDNEWYKVKREDICKLGGAGLLHYYNYSLSRALAAVYPTVPWEPWRFQMFTNTSPFVNDVSVLRRYIQFLSRELSIQKLDDWYRVSLNQIREMGGYTLLVENGGLPAVLAKLYPEHNWDEGRFINGRGKRVAQRWLRVSLGQLFSGADRRGARRPSYAGGSSSSSSSRSSSNMDGRRQYSTTTTTTTTTTMTTTTTSGASTTHQLKSDAKGCATSVIRQRQRQRRRQQQQQQHQEQQQQQRLSWRDPGSHRRFFDEAAKQLNIQKSEDWYSVTHEAICRLGGAALLKDYYSDSLVRALSAVYPEHEWLPWKFPGGVPKGFWRDHANQRRFFDWAAVQLGIVHLQQQLLTPPPPPPTETGKSGGSESGSGSSESGWYSVKRTDIWRLGGSGLLKQCYAGSLTAALLAVYPELRLLPWKFASGVPKHFWKDLANHRRFFDWAAAELGIHPPDTPEGWYAVSREDVCRLGGEGLLKEYYSDSLFKALSSVYPTMELHPWRFKHFVVKDNTTEVAS